MKFTWGHGIIVFFITFLTWIISFVIFSFGENNDLVTKDYYKQGADYSTHMAIDSRSRPYKDSISIKNLEDMVIVAFSSSLLSNTSDKEIYFYRPSNKEDDLKLLATPNNKVSKVSKNQLKKGRYKVSFSWKMNGEKYKIVKDFTVK